MPFEPHPFTEWSEEKQREFHQKGAHAMHKARREKKLLKEEILKRMKVSDWNEMCDNLIDRAKKTGRDFEVLRDTIGQKPVQEVEAIVETMSIEVDIEDEPQSEDSEENI